jgi:membrane associated rhomboid family serine protease
MASGGPDLFVICKNCGAEVSPYITECPYCGKRLRKRAPRLDRPVEPPKRSARPKPRSADPTPRPRPRLRSREPRRGTGKPVVTIALVLAALVVTLGYKAMLWSGDSLVLNATNTDDLWRMLTTTFLYSSFGYQLVALTNIFLFGWLLERRHGWWAPLLVYVLGSAAGMGAVIALDPDLAAGGNAPALALLAAWAVRDLLGRRKHREDDSDLLGALVLAAVLVLLPVAVVEANALAGLGGGLAGLVLGLVLALVPER